MAAVIVEQVSATPQQQLFTQASAYLHDQLRSVFENCEKDLLAAGEQIALCCDLRRARRTFTDNYLNQLWLRCENPASDWVIGGTSGVTHARTLAYLVSADEAVRELYQSQAESVGRLAALWVQQTGLHCSVFDCPLLPHTLTKLFLLLLPDLPVPLAIRYRLAVLFVRDLPPLFDVLQQSLINVMQRRGVVMTAVQPQPLPEWWEPLEKPRKPSVAALALVVPPRTVDSALLLSHEIAEAALADDRAQALSLINSQRATSLLPWLGELMGAEAGSIPPEGQDVLCLLAGPLLRAACDESFSDHAHPARRVLEEWRHWAPGWQVQVGIQGVVPERCRLLAVALAQHLVRDPVSIMQAWQAMLDYLLQLRKRLQQNLSAVVASTRLSLQVLEVRTEVDALLADRAGLESWPPVVIEILHQHWSALLLSIHWQEGTASSAWLHAIAVADELLASVQPGVDQQTRQHLMQRVPQLLQGLRKGFDTLGCDRRHYSTLLDRLQKVHLALLRGQQQDTLEVPELWPLCGQMPEQSEAFVVGTWLRQADGRVLSVEFSDAWCTALCDGHSATLECCATAALQAEFYEGNLEIVAPPASLLPVMPG